MKKILVLIILLLFPTVIYAVEINSPYYILYNLNDNDIIMEENADEVTYIASLTKIATAITAIENIENLDEVVTIPSEGLEGLIEANASVAGFKLGESVTYRDLLYGLMLPSGADAAQTLAYYIAGSEDDFVVLMNELANKLNLENTNFVNNTGLHHDMHYSTVKEISEILLYALENSDFKEIFTASKYLTSNKNITMTISYQSIINNYDLTNNYITGGKTGFTDQSGYCFASTASFNDINFLLVTAGADSSTRTPNHIIDAINIYDYVQANFKYNYIFEKGDILDYIPTKYSDINQYNVLAPSSYQFYTDTDFDKKDYEFNFVGIDYLTPSSKTGDIGKLEIIYNGRVIDEIDISYDGSLKYDIEGYILNYWQYIAGAILFIILLLIGLRKRKKR